MKPRLAIISSYSELCGIAEYADALKSALSNDYAVSVIPLNIDILQSDMGNMAEQHIQELIEQVKSFDFVNIQFEPALFGMFPGQIYKRFSGVVSACKRLAITMHQVEVNSSQLKQIKNNHSKMTFKIILKELILHWRRRSFCKLHKKILRLAEQRKASIIVHTPREHSRVKYLAPNISVFEHPLAYFNAEDLKTYKAKYPKEDFLNLYGLSSDKKYLGVFGFLAPYKGVDVVINSLRFLPSDYELLIFGSQHPQNIRHQPKGDLYLLSILNQLEELGESIRNRVHFIGSLFNHDEVIQAMMGCDQVILPYNEIGQSSSGIAAICLDLQLNTLMSQNLLFLELWKYAPGALAFFSIGNHLELAQKILKKSQEQYLPEIQAYNQKYNRLTNAATYRKALEASGKL
jgi:glycosyltransferase involved in cell wall biosynthesis